MMRLGDIVMVVVLAVVLTASFCNGDDRGVSIRPAAPGSGEVVGDQWLLVIGIDTYLHWPRLKTAGNDARAVRDILLERYYFEKRHLIELYDAKATRKNIIAALRRLATELKSDDALVIFYAGHGHLDPITKEGSWIPVESGTTDASAWISNHAVKNYLKIDAIKARHILLISDSCFAGDFFRGRRGKLPEINQKVIQKAYRLTSRQAITSGGLEPVSDAGFGGNSVFSHFLVQALRDNRDPFTVPSALFPQIKAGVAENAEQFPQFGALKGTGGQQGGELVLFLRKTWRLDALAADSARKSEELDRLRRMEVDAEAAKEKENAEIARREREVAALDAKIAELRGSLGTPAETDDSLDTMLAMVQEKEAQQRHLELLKQQREEEAAKRQGEIERLRDAQEKQRMEALEADIDKYLKIVGSPYGEKMKAAAWKSLVRRHPEAGDLPVGDIGALRRRAYPRYAAAVSALVSSVQTAGADGRLNKARFDILYDVLIRKGSGGMSDRARRFNEARVKSNRDDDDIQVSAAGHCNSDRCQDLLVFQDAGKPQETIMEIPADLTADQVDPTARKALQSLARILLQRQGLVE